MWDLTADTHILKELPEEYTFETALADLIDNSLQAVWTSRENDRRLISVHIAEDKISIFDTGQGMDSSEENSIAKWGKLGASLNRTSKEHDVGGKPPYLKINIRSFLHSLSQFPILTLILFIFFVRSCHSFCLQDSLFLLVTIQPFFGMFGYGGPIASMHLGRRALVSSKTKVSNKVFTLHLEREALLKCSNSEFTWQTNGGIRVPSEDESTNSPHGSFTKVISVSFCLALCIYSLVSSVAYISELFSLKIDHGPVIE